MKHKILSRNPFNLVFKFHCVRFSSIKKLRLQRRNILSNLIALIVFVTHKVKKNNPKIPKRKFEKLLLTKISMNFQTLWCSLKLRGPRDKPGVDFLLI